MFQFLKYLPLVTAFQDVSAQVKEAGREKRPWYLQRSIIGGIIALVAGFLSIRFGVSLSADQIGNLTDNASQLITAGVAVYGTILSLYGLVMKAIKAQSGGK